jgi:hypothetical protein
MNQLGGDYWLMACISHPSTRMLMFGWRDLLKKMGCMGLKEMNGDKAPVLDCFSICFFQTFLRVAWEDFMRVFSILPQESHF